MEGSLESLIAFSRSSEPTSAATRYYHHVIPLMLLNQDGALYAQLNCTAYCSGLSPILNLAIWSITSNVSPVEYCK
ncbi:FAD-linked oxidoreductase aurO [Fusarium oxysporum f. sp. albedinis]|nr:FAD-linked oxidoreductase aurO [Fusarium oxysporum f. sp. albedinis]